MAREHAIEEDTELSDVLGVGRELLLVLDLGEDTAVEPIEREVDDFAGTTEHFDDTIETTDHLERELT